jgi:hypothetical protein
LKVQEKRRLGAFRFGKWDAERGTAGVFGQECASCGVGRRLKTKDAMFRREWKE